MAKISKSIEIAASVEDVYAFLTQPNNLPEIWPSMVSVSNVERKDDGSHSFDFVYKMAGIHFHGKANTVDVESNKRVLVKTEGGLPSEFEYLYERVGDGARLTINVDYTIPGQVLGRLAERIVHRLNEREADVFLENLKTRLEMAQAPREEIPAPAP